MSSSTPPTAACQSPYLRAFLVTSLCTWPFSITIGEFEVGVNVVCAIAIGAAVTAHDPDALIKARSTITFAAVALISGLAIFAVGPCTDGGVKSFASAAVFLVYFTCIAVITTTYTSAAAFLPEREGLLVLAFCAAGLLLQRSGFAFSPSDGAGYEEGARLGGFFSEPSHLALAACLPLSALAMSRGLRYKLAAAAFVGVFLSLSSSATLVLLLCAGAVSGLAHGYRRSRSLAWGLLGVVVALGIVAAGLTMSEDFLTRFNAIVDPQQGVNVSSLVWQNGFIVAIENLVRTHGLGLGFNAMGCNPDVDTWIYGALAAIGVGRLNYNDGSFLVSKLMSEMGAAGLIMAAYASWIAVAKSRAATPETERHGLLFVLSTVCVVSFFIRSGGYFGGLFPVFLALVCVGARRRTSWRLV